MIYLNSRYLSGVISRIPDSRADNELRTTLFRQWPATVTSYFLYYWVDEDRPDLVAARYLGDPDRWWEIMDLNPEILHPMFIDPGTPVRIPSD